LAPNDPAELSVAAVAFGKMLKVAAIARNDLTWMT
jgi:hypothetical protein